MAPAEPKTSHVSISDSISTEAVAHEAFVPGDANLFPKWPSKIDDNSWEEWQFQAMAADGSAAVVVILFRHTGNAPAGFRVGINASWAAGPGEKDTVWCNHVALPQSVVTSDPAAQILTGVWRGEAEGCPPHVSFEVATDLSRALVTFDVPGKISGTLKLTSLGYESLPASEKESKFMPTFWWMRPIAMAGADAELSFCFGAGEEKEEKSMRLCKDNGAFASMERAWSAVPMHKCFSQSWWLWARAGPFLIQIIWIMGRPEADGAVWATARLYHDGKLVCAPQKAVAAGAETTTHQEDTFMLEYLQDEEESAAGIRGNFRLKNTGHRLLFSTADGKGKWEFKSRHVRPWYNMPTGPPGPKASGLSGFVLSVSGGPEGSKETFQGPGIVGGGTMP